MNTILHVWALREQQRRARNRFLVACLMVGLAMVAGYVWGMV